MTPPYPSSFLPLLTLALWEGVLTVDYLYVGSSLVPPVKPTRVLTTPAAQPNWAWQSEIFSATFLWNIFTAHLGEPKSGHPEWGFGQVGLVVGGHHRGCLMFVFYKVTKLSTAASVVGHSRLLSVKFDSLAARHWKLVTCTALQYAVRASPSPYYSLLTEYWVVSDLFQLSNRDGWESTKLKYHFSLF